jgi:nucleoside-diphosphate-sugar epimerase
MKETHNLFDQINLKEKIICVTGGSGFIGKKLIEELTKIGCRVRALSRKKDVKFSKNVNVFIGDLTDPNFSLKDFIEDCDIFYHCAGEVNHEAQMSLLHINGTQKLIEAIKSQSNLTQKKLHWIQLSSCGAYGPPIHSNIEIKRLITEISDTNPVNEYEKTKTKSDEMVIKSSVNSFSYTILRPSNVIGPSMTNQSVHKLIKFVNSGYFFFIGKKDAVCTYVHADDVVKAMLSISINSKSKNEIFNLSSDCDWKVLINQISLLLKVKILPIRIPYKFIQIPFYIVKLLFGKFIKIPQIDPFVYRTSYSTKKIEYLLNFKFSKPMPHSIKDLIN